MKNQLFLVTDTFCVLTSVIDSIAVTCSQFHTKGTKILGSIKVM